MNKIGSKKFQKYSEVDLFNKIGFMARTLGYDPVYFKYKYMHYIHLYKNEDMQISIYYDKLGAMFPEKPYYELYDKCDIERFLDTEEDRSELLNKLKELLD